MASARPFALWLVPEAGAAARLSALIEALGRRWSGPLFAPHMTLFGGHGDDDATAAAAVTRLAERGAPLTLPVRGTELGTAYFTTFFLKLGDDGAAADACEAARAALDPGSPYVLRPHLSLLYAQLDGAARRTLGAERLDLPETLLFDRYALVRPGTGARDWLDVAAWRVVHEAPLTQSAG